MISCSDYFIVSDNVQYIKRGWINRNRILINGQAIMITAPVIKDSTFLDINERYFKNDAFARDRFIKSIRNAYCKAPNFKDCYELLEEILHFKNNNVAEFIYNSLKEVCSYLEIKALFLKESEFNIPSELDYQDTVLYLCNELKAERYINSIGGIELYSAKKFKSQGIELKFVKTSDLLKYKQFNNSFIPDLSIIDVMMFNSQTEIRQLLTEYDLIDGKN